MPIKIYGALLAVHGTSMQEYVMKLMFLYGLLSSLQAEYSLSKHYEKK